MALSKVPSMVYCTSGIKVAFMPEFHFFSPDGMKHESVRKMVFLISSSASSKYDPGDGFTASLPTSL